MIRDPVQACVTSHNYCFHPNRVLPQIMNLITAKCAIVYISLVILLF